MIIRFDIYNLGMRERAAAALASLGFVEDQRRGYTLQIEPDKRFHALFASDGLELHCDLVRANQTHKNVKHKQLRPTLETLKERMAQPVMKAS
ncbi:MAG TPA: hypothetical protein VGF48_05850 [Thermoanaerobaculia bacterium]|jgi:hypothetical protein